MSRYLLKTAGFAMVMSFFTQSVTANSSLEKRIELLEKELSALKKELVVMQSKKEAPKQATVKSVRSGPTLGGRLMQDYSAFSTDDVMKTGLNPATKESSGLRGAWLEIRGRFDEKLSYNFQYDFAKGADVSAKQINLKYRGESKRALLIGHMKEPFGLDNLISTKHVTFMEQGLCGLFTPGYNAGFFVMDENPEHKFSWSFGLFNDDVNDNARTGLVGTANWNRTMRLVYTPTYKDNGRQVMHLGTGWTYRNANGTNVRFRGKPESALWDLNFVDTGNIAAESADVQNLEMAWVNGPFSLQGEYFQAGVNRMIGADNKFSGYYMLASYFLTGEHRSYNPEYRLFGGVRPKKNYTEGGRGAWEIATRYSEADLNDGFVSGGELSSWTLGLNWVPTYDTRVMWNYVNSELEGRGKAESINMRLQFAF